MPCTSEIAIFFCFVNEFKIFQNSLSKEPLLVKAPSATMAACCSVSAVKISWTGLTGTYR